MGSQTGLKPISNHIETLIQTLKLPNFHPVVAIALKLLTDVVARLKMMRFPHAHISVDFTKPSAGPGSR